MKPGRLFSILILATILFSECVDRIEFDTRPAVLPVALDGFITDQPGPYEVRVNRAFDIESRNTPKIPVSVRRLEIFDNVGNQERLQEVEPGVYRTDPARMRGVVGRSYRVVVELLDGRIYESVPDTLLPSGQVEAVKYTFVSGNSASNPPGFDVTFDALGSELNRNYYLWRFIGTYQVDTNPEQADVACGESRCPRPRPCSGYVIDQGLLLQVSPCSCCTCWVDFYNNVPILSDNRFITNSRFQDIQAAFVPLDQWIFLYRVYVRIEQRSLSRRAFLFWKAIQDQKEAANSLFQPISGRLPRNFIQRAGTGGGLEGIFYATSISTKGVFISRNDVPNQSLIPLVVVPFRESCLELPNSTNVKPAFWN